MVKLNIDKLEVLYDNVLVKAEPVEAVGDVITPSQYEDKPEIGVVVKVGPGNSEDGKTYGLSVKKGDIVFFNKYSTTKFKVDGLEYYVVREEDIVSYQRD